MRTGSEAEPERERGRLEGSPGSISKHDRAWRSDDACAVRSLAQAATGSHTVSNRSERLRELNPHLEWAPNIWMGVSVENAKYTSRIDDLRATGAHIKFLSLEPLLGPLNGLRLDGIHWAIVGGESGPGARTIDEEWVLDIRDQCRRSEVPFFFKQWGGVNKKRTGRLLEGRTWDEMPASVAG